jgi:DNA (cytosine-5)-methyltransferase 1
MEITRVVKRKNGGISISFSDLGAPHIRERLFIVAYPNGYIGLDGVLQTGRDTFSEWRKKSVWGFDWSKSKMESRPATILQRWQRLAVRQSPLIRMDDGIPDVVERLHATGNAVVPAVAEFIGNCVMKAQARLTPREPDNGDSAPSQAFSTPDTLFDLEGLS